MTDMNEVRRLPFKTVFLFALGSFGVGLLFSLGNTYFLYFVTDVALVPAGIMGTVFLCTRIFDFCWTPIVAGLVQNLTPKYGKYRSWIYYSLPVVSVFVVLCFTKIEGNPILVAIFYGMMYLLSYGLLDKPGGAQKGLMTRMAANDGQRMMLSSRCNQFEVIGNIVFAAICLPLVALLGGTNADGTTNEAKGFFWVAIIFALICWGLYYVTAHAGKKYDVYGKSEGREASTKMNFKDMVRAVFKNPPLLCSMLIEVCRYLGLMVFVSTMFYYFLYVLNDPGAISLAMVLANLASLAGSFAAPYISKLLGKKNTSVLGMGLFAVALLFPRFINGGATLLTVAICIGYFGFALQTCVGVVMYSKAADYYQSKTGIKAHAFVMNMYVLPVEIGIAFSVSIVGWLLAAVGYNPLVEPTAQVIAGIENLVLLVPALFFALGTIIAIAHPLSEKRLQKVHAVLQQQAAGADAQPADADAPPQA